jgi:hypothetical protein
MFNWVKKYWVLALIILILSGWMIFLYFVGPEEVVEYIGVENTYLAAFLLAVFGGISAVTGFSFFAAVATFSAGGANIFLLGIFGGLGVFISDTIFYIIARRAVKVLEEKQNRFLIWLTKKIRQLPLWLALVFVYLYLGFTPLPNDILMIG